VREGKDKPWKIKYKCPAGHPIANGAKRNKHVKQTGCLFQEKRG
jgi:hypothetical protein